MRLQAMWQCRSLAIALCLCLVAFNVREAAAFSPLAVLPFGRPRTSVSPVFRAVRLGGLKMCTEDTYSDSVDDTEASQAPEAPLDDKPQVGPLKAARDFFMQPITMSLARSVASLFAGSFVMTASIAAVLVVWATSPSSMPPVVGDSATLSEEQRQVALSQKSVLFDEVFPPGPLRATW
jgi:hypothetical protein